MHPGSERTHRASCVHFTLRPAKTVKLTGGKEYYQGEGKCANCNFR